LILLFVHDALEIAHGEQGKARLLPVAQEKSAGCVAF
jgi:hypothetical protein